MRKLDFQNVMYAYAAEEVNGYADTLKICMPDLFPDKSFGDAVDYKTNNGSSKNILINNDPPAISDFIHNRNYLIIDLKTEVNLKVGDKIVVAFMNCDPRYGSYLRMG